VGRVERKGHVVKRGTRTVVAKRVQEARSTNATESDLKTYVGYVRIGNTVVGFEIYCNSSTVCPYADGFCGQLVRVNEHVFWI